jgi:hypothetical protein
MHALLLTTHHYHSYRDCVWCYDVRKQAAKHALVNSRLNHSAQQQLKLSLSLGAQQQVLPYLQPVAEAGPSASSNDLITKLNRKPMLSEGKRDSFEKHVPQISSRPVLSIGLMWRNEARFQHQNRYIYV